MKKHKTFVGALALAASLVLALAPTTYGQSSSVEAYGGQGGNIASSVQGGSPAAGNPVSAGSSAGPAGLPFTGLDVLLLVGGGTVLLLMGLAMARMARRSESAGDS
jgi:hypothetical protein